jgi:hypothetical protein
LRKVENSGKEVVKMENGAVDGVEALTEKRERLSKEKKEECCSAC